MSSTTATTISLSWSVPSGSVVDSYEVVWERDDARSGTTITDGSTSYTITGLEEDSSYTITVTATNAAGSAASEPVTGRTLKTGTDNSIHNGTVMTTTTILSSSSPTSWPAECHCGLNNSHHHLPLLECSQWLSGGQL